MPQTMPIPNNVIRDDFTTDRISGGRGNDHLIHHRDLSVEGHSSTGLVGFAGDDILEGSVPNTGQIHMFAATGNDWLILDVTKIPDAGGMQGHHAYGGNGQNTFQFTNIEQNFSPIMGRLDDFDPTSDRILIEDTEINLTDLPLTVQLPGGGFVEVRVVEIEHPEFIDENLGTQYFLAIGDDIFYALEGARDLQNGTSGLTGEERHFLLPDALETLREAETVQYVNPKNFVPREFYEHREDELTLNWAPKGEEVHAELGDNDAVHMFGGKGNPPDQGSHGDHSHGGHSAGQQVMRGSDGDDVINGNSGNDTIFGGYGDDLIAGGIDNDVLYGGPGDDMIWGGDGNDSLFGGRGDDYLHGGRGDDFLAGGEGNDTLVGGSGNNTLVGGGGEDAVNRFHFFEDDSNDVITDFKVGSDLITLQDDIDPLSVEIYENDDGNTVLRYGQNDSVELRGVSLKDFEEAAELRAEDDDPIITITPDPEEELLQELRVETGYYGEKEPPSLMIEGTMYGNTAFFGAGAGGYTFVTQDDDVDSPEDEQELSHSHGHEQEHEHEVQGEEDDEEDEEAQQDEDEGSDGSCFVATAAYRDPSHPDVVFLRAFRDQWLAHRRWGRAFIAFYWRVGPKMARPVRRSPRLAGLSKALISGIVRSLRQVWTSVR